MKIALVDYENNKSLKKIWDEKPDEVVVFTSKKAALEPLPHTYECKVVNCLNGERDAMDIQLSYYLGLNCKKENEYIIYSSDKGYDSMINFACDKGFKIRRQEIKEEKKIKECSKTSFEKLEEAKKDIINNNFPKKVSHPNIWHLSNIISILTGDEIGHVYTILSGCRQSISADKNRAAKLFCKHFGDECSKFLMNNFKTISCILED